LHLKICEIISSEGSCKKKQRRSYSNRKIGRGNKSEPLIKLRKDEECAEEAKNILVVTSGREQDNLSDQAKFKSQPSDLIEKRSTVGSHCGYRKEN
jgi:hypothetical protein